MPPQQIPSVSAPPPTNQYDFIVNYNHRPANDWLLHAPLKTRIMVVGGGLLALILIAWIFIALLSATTGGSVQSFTALAQEQAELARISNDPSRNAQSEPALNFASTTRLSLLSDELSFVGYLTSLNAAPSSDSLAKDRNPQTDATLQSAQNSGTYDQMYTAVAQQQLTTYIANLKHAYSATSNLSERQLISDAYSHAQLLLALSQDGS